MALSLTDSHIHLSFLPKKDLSNFLETAQSHGVRRFIMAGYDPKDWEVQSEIKTKFPNCLSAFGLHPWVSQKLTVDDLLPIMEQLKSQLLKADFLGELGLDHHSAKTETEKLSQQMAFNSQLDFALEMNKPIVLHSVQAHGKVIETLSQRSSQWRGIVHAFTGSPEVAKQYINLGLKISIGPGILSSGFKKLKETVGELPMESLVIETDSPSAHGQTPDPQRLIQVFTELAKLCKVEEEPLSKALEKNIDSLLNPDQ